MRSLGSVGRPARASTVWRSDRNPAEDSQSSQSRSSSAPTPSSDAKVLGSQAQHGNVNALTWLESPATTRHGAVQSAAPVTEAAGCRWCHDLSRPLPDRPMWDRPLLATEAFNVVPSLGSLVPGWLLIAPASHRLRLADCSPSELTDLCSLENQLERILASRFGPVVAFEHGPRAKGTAVGCSVDHAHLHMVPMSVDIFAAATRRAPHLAWERAAGINDALVRVATDESYLLLRQQDGTTLLCVDRDDAIPSQLFRRAIADNLHAEPEWDWKSNPCLTEISETIEVLSSVLDCQ